MSEEADLGGLKTLSLLLTTLAAGWKPRSLRVAQAFLDLPTTASQYQLRQHFHLEASKVFALRNTSGPASHPRKFGSE